jgi:hypothetical protein
MTWASAMAGGILHPWLQHAMAKFGDASGGIDEWQPKDGGFGSGPHGHKSRLKSFFIIEHWFLVPADISNQHQSFNFLYRFMIADTKKDLFLYHTNRIF